MSDRPLPTVYEETRFYWDGAKEGKLLLNSCPTCDQAYFPPRPFCPTCGCRDVEVIEATGKGRLYSYVISNLPAPGYTPPFTVAVVMLDEGVKMVSNIEGLPPEPEALELDMPLEVTFETRGDMKIPQFKPVSGGAA